MSAIQSASFNQLFLEARTHNAWQNRPVSEDTLRQLYELTRWPPTSLNTQPARFYFVTSQSAKERLKPFLLEGNVAKTMAAPVTVLVAWATEYYERLDTQFPAFDARPMFRGNSELAESTAFRNSSLQAGYLILAARALGLDCGPMSGFDEAGLNQEFFPDGQHRVNLLINLGYGDQEGVYPRNPRLDFSDACQIL
jgi:3-hydroxypropanoate dehydrogenase